MSDKLKVNEEGNSIELESGTALVTTMRVPIVGEAKTEASWYFDLQDLRRTMEQARRDLGRNERVELIIFTEAAYQAVIEYVLPKQGREPEDAPKQEERFGSILGVPFEVYATIAATQSRIASLRIHGDRRKIMLVSV